jgi:NitT/TauT family transport system ATP-binding protein
MTTAPHTLLEFRNVTRRFLLPQGEVTVIDDISFKALEGEFISIVGPSGAGKSTLLRMMNGLLAPSSGEVLYNGVTQKGINFETSMVFQNFGLLPWLTVSQNIELGLEARSKDSAYRKAQVDRYITKVGLEGYEEAYPRELSGGMKQRVGLARALAIEPSLLLMDEPFSSLDVLTSINLRNELLDIWSDRENVVNTMIMVTHNIEEAIELSDRILILSNRPGKIAGELKIDLPRPRRKRDPLFSEYVDRVFSLLA